MSVSFAALGVPANLVEHLKQRGITEAFPIQEASIPDALAGRDVVGKAVTGSGKTLAFGLPLMARLTKARPRKPVALVLVPTRELAAQVQKEFAQLTDDRGRRVICIYGGTSYNVARKALNFGVDVVVACPGRLEDMLEQGALDLSSVTTVVVDEADRMADMGFLPCVRRIIGATNRDRHVMLFSATMGPDVKSLVKEFTHDAAVHDVVGDEAPVTSTTTSGRSRASSVPRSPPTSSKSTNARSSSPAPSTAPTAWRVNSKSAASPRCHCTATAPRPNANARCAASRTDRSRSSSRLTSPRAVSTSNSCPSSSTTTRRRKRPTTCTVPAVPVEPERPARSSRSWARTSLVRSVDCRRPWASTRQSSLVKTPSRSAWAPSTTPSRPSASTIAVARVVPSVRRLAIANVDRAASSAHRVSAPSATEPRAANDRPTSRATNTSHVHGTRRASRAVLQRPSRAERARASRSREQRTARAIARPERVFTDRAPRPERSGARDTHFTKGASSARGK